MSDKVTTFVNEVNGIFNDLELIARKCYDHNKDLLNTINNKEYSLEAEIFKKVVINKLIEMIENSFHRHLAVLAGAKESINSIYAIKQAIAKTNSSGGST